MGDQGLPFNGFVWFDSLAQLDGEALVNLDALFGDAGAAAPQPPEQAPTRKKAGRKPLTAAEKAARVDKEREQNRVMQARYRARQKERRAELEEQHEAASADLERVRAEHSSLAHVNSVLEALLDVRDSTLGILQRAKDEAEPAQQAQQAQREGREGEGQQELAGPPYSYGGVPNHVRARELLTSGDAASWHALTELGDEGGQGQGRQGGPCPRSQAPGGSGGSGDGGAAAAAGSGGGIDQGVAALALGEPASEAGGVGPPRQGLGQHHGSVVAGRPPAEAGLSHLGILDVHPDSNVQDLYGIYRAAEADPRVLAEVQACTPDQYVSSWRAFQEAARDIVAQHDLTHDPQVLQGLRPLMEAGAILMSLMLRHNAVCVQRLFASSADHGLSDEQERQKWDGVAAALGITPHQRERYLQLSVVYERKVGRLRDHKHQAVTLLRQVSGGSLASDSDSGSGAGAGGGGGGASAGGGAAVGLNGMVSQYLQVLEAAAQLSSYPDSEFTALLELLSETGRLFTPLQKARVLAMSYPHFPDVLRIVEAVKRLPPS